MSCMEMNKCFGRAIKPVVIDFDSFFRLSIFFFVVEELNNFEWFVLLMIYENRID